MQTPTWHEQAVVFDCEGCRLIGIVTQPETQSEHGVVIVVGGPQYRAGSHRQFTLLARNLAEQGIPSLRFDYRGMGDSEGEFRNFEEIHADIHAAIDVLVAQIPRLSHVALWGLCDAASAALYYGHTDTRVSDVILLNPWVHHEALAAKTRLKYYYLTRLLQRSFWTKLLAGGVGLRNSLGDLHKSVKSAASSEINDSGSVTMANPRHGSQTYLKRMLEGLKLFRGKVLFILSGNDLVAQEFITLSRQDSRWEKICASPTITTKRLDAANHTFSSQSWRDQVGEWTIEQINKNANSPDQKERTQ